MKRIYFFILISILCFGSYCRAEEVNVRTIFKKAAHFYEKGEYDKALGEYKKMLDAGLESGNLYYNIGNCYFKKGEFGKAILNYERAERLIPRDSDLKSNYDYAVYKSASGIAWEPRNFILKITNTLFGGLTLNGLSLALSVLYISLIGLVILGIFVKFLKGYIVSILILLAVIFSLGSFDLYKRISRVGSEAVIIQKGENAKFAPIDSATTFFRLDEGEKVRIIDSRNGDTWYRIKRADGKTGWVKASSFEKI